MPGEAGYELLDLRLQVLDFGLLRLDCFDQQRRQSGVVHALNFVRLWIARDLFRHKMIEILSHHTDLTLAIALALVGEASSCSTFSRLLPAPGYLS
jgi:hypothetical protein